MAGINDTTKLDKAYKVLQRVTNTDPNKGALNESITSKILLSGADIWLNTPPTTPPVGSTADVEVEADFTLTLRLDTFVAGQAWAAHSTPGDTSSAIATDWIPPAFGEGYYVELQDDNGDVVPVGSAINWEFDYGSGVLFIQDPTAVSYTTPFHLVGYRYIGPTMEGGGGTGGIVSSDGASTDMAIVRWDGTTGQLVQNSSWIIDDDGGLGATISDDLAVWAVERVSNDANGLQQFWLNNSASPAANDYLQRINHIGKDSAGSNVTYVQFNSQIGSPTQNDDYGIYWIGIRGGAIGSYFTTTWNGNDGSFELKRENALSATGPEFETYAAPATPTDNSRVWTQHHHGHNDAAAKTEYATATVHVRDVSAGVEKSSYTVSVMHGLAEASFLYSLHGGDGVFRIEFQDPDDPNLYGAGLELYGNALVPAANTFPASIGFYGNDSAVSKVMLARWLTELVDPTAGSHAARVIVGVAKAVGGVVEHFRLENEQIIARDGGDALPPYTFASDNETGMYYIGGASFAGALGSHAEGKLFYNYFGVGIQGETEDYSLSVFGLPDTDHSPLGTLLIDAGDWSDANLTASTPVKDVFYAGRTKEWPTGDITQQIYVDFDGQTPTFVGASVIADFITVRIGVGRAGTNATILRSYALKTDGIWNEGAWRFDVKSVTSSGTYAVTQFDHVLNVSATDSGAVTIDLPPSATAGAGRYIGVKDYGLNCSVNNITVVANGGADNIDEAASFIMSTDGEFRGFYNNGGSAGWSVR